MSASLGPDGLACSMGSLRECAAGHPGRAASSANDPLALAPEERLLAAAQSRDAGAFRALVRLHQASVYSVALRMLQQPEDAQELAQDVFLLLHRKLSSISSAAHLRNWLRRTVCHRAIDRLRRRQPAPMLSLSAAEAIEDPRAQIAAGTELQLRQLLSPLPPMARAVVLLRYQEDLDPTDIARVLQLPLNTVKSHLRRSLGLLRQRMMIEVMA